MSKPKFHHLQLVLDKWVNKSTPQSRWEAQPSRRHSCGLTLSSMAVSLGAYAQDIFNSRFQCPPDYYKCQLAQSIILTLNCNSNLIHAKLASILKFSLCSSDEKFQLSLWAMKYKENKGLQTKALQHYQNCKQNCKDICQGSQLWSGVRFQNFWDIYIYVVLWNIVVYCKGFLFNPI